MIGISTTTLPAVPEKFKHPWSLRIHFNPMR